MSRADYTAFSQINPKIAIIPTIFTGKDVKFLEISVETMI